MRNRAADDAFSVFETWWDKYRTRMQDINARREATTAKLNAYLDQMGYVAGMTPN